MYIPIMKGYISFYIDNIGSLGQRAENLLAVEVGVLKKKSATSAIKDDFSLLDKVQIHFSPLYFDGGGFFSPIRSHKFNEIT